MCQIATVGAIQQPEPPLDSWVLVRIGNEEKAIQWLFLHTV